MLHVDPARSNISFGGAKMEIEVCYRSTELTATPTPTSGLYFTEQGLPQLFGAVDFTLNSSNTLQL
jgi:hypothetical protein